MICKIKPRKILLLVAALGLLAVACNSCALFTDDEPPRNATVIAVTANSSLAPWLSTAVGNFNAERQETPDGNPIHVQLELVEAGQAVVDIAAGNSAPGLWIPDDQVWVDLLADKGTASFQGDCRSVAESPLVIALWRPIAESLGWPGRSLGWLDVGSLAADPSAWNYYSGGQFGETLQLGHTHPGLSGSGVGTLLALVQAAESETEAVEANVVEKPVVQASVSAFEAAVAWFSSSTNELGRTMSERGTDYLGAAVMYESTVVYYGAGNPNIVPIYPFEGTFVAQHPACINNGATAAEQAAAQLFREYLLAEEAQQLALTNGLRPVNAAVPLGAPLDAEHGVDLEQPVVIFNSPRVETVYAVQDLWKAARKDVNLVMVLDVSGSMGGDKLRSAQTAAVQFVNQMGEDDYISIVAFSTTSRILVAHKKVGEERQRVINVLQNLEADDYTAFYDALGDASSILAKTNSSETSNAIVALTDGLDNSSVNYAFDQTLIEVATAHNTTICTIAYGNDADEQILVELALQAHGNFYHGDEASIETIYQEMSAAFGGSVGVGR
ncbi:MAG: VWA domain-containing protein [Chloroflexota bacterium]|nr:VWA domain-containing protein [Chloroflexota bacterium]